MGLHINYWRDGSASVLDTKTHHYVLANVSVEEAENYVEENEQDYED